MKTNSRTYDLIVIGGGPSGMMAAGRAAELGARVLILEKNKQLGRKLLLTGGGRCNITKAIFDVRKFLENFPETKNFLYSPFSKFSVKETFDFFEKRRLPLVIEAKDRAFPKGEQSTDVLVALERYMKENNVEIKKETKVTSLKQKTNGTWEVKTKEMEFGAQNVALATGGLALPETGSTGDGFKMLEKLGHKTGFFSPNLVPLKVKEDWVHSLSGVTLSFMTIGFIQDKKLKFKKRGKILFTHFGVSGPLILNSSFEVTKLLKKGQVYASIDMFPDTEEQTLEHTVFKLFEKNKNKKIKNVLPEILPGAVSEEILKFKDIDLSEREVNSITKEERKALVKKLKNLTFEITGTLGFEKAIASIGGVSPREINFKNMTSNLFDNLYLLGDIIDINRPSGGFSLQLCWTTGWVAGTDVGKKVQGNISVV